MRKIIALAALAIVACACGHKPAKDIKNYENFYSEKQVKEIEVRRADVDLYAAKITYKFENGDISLPTYNLYLWTKSGVVSMYSNCELKFECIERVFPEALEDSGYLANKETWRKLDASEIKGISLVINSNPEIIEIKQKIENARNVQKALDESRLAYIRYATAKVDSVEAVIRMKQLEIQRSIDSLNCEAESIIRQIKSELSYGIH